MGALEHFFGVLAVVTLTYAAVMAVYAGIGASFLGFWLGIGAGSIMIRIWLAHLVRVHAGIPKAIAIPIFVLVIAGILVFVFLEFLIAGSVRKQPKKQPDVVLVLGAQIRGTRITRSLRYRLDAAITYLKEKNTNLEIKVVVSGGKGDGETISEAQAMKEYLIQAGIPSRQILCEDQSTNTFENFQYTRKRLLEIGEEIEHKNILVVTNGFHLYRSTRIAKRIFSNVEGLAAKTDPILALNYYVRESMAVMKDFLVGNLSLWD